MDYRLQDLIDIPLFQTLQDKLNEVYSFPSAIIDNDGNVLTATAWQDICTKFHRPHPECGRECRASDQYILSHLHEANPAVTYRCPHGLVDNATPIVIGGKHLGNYFTGQLFLEPPDLEYFRQQAARYGFDEAAYLDAVARVPVWTQEKLTQYLDFIKGFTQILAGIGHKNLQEIEARALLAEKDEALRNTHAFNQQIIDSAQEGIIVYGPDLRYLVWNPFMEGISGVRAADVLGKHPVEVFPFLRDVGMVERIEMALGGGTPAPIDFSYTTPDGKTGWASDTCGPLHDEGGRVVGAIATVREITGRKAVEEALRLSEERFAKAFYHSPDAVNINRLRDGLYVNVNSGFLDLLGYEREEVIGHSSLELDIWVDPEDRERLVEGLTARGEVSNLEARFRAKNGDEHVALMSASVIALDGEPHILSVTRDITERKLAEAEIARLSRLYAALSEINQALVRVQSRQDLFDEICRVLVTAGGFQMAWVGWVEPGTLEIRVVASHGDDTGYLDGIRLFADDRPEGRGPTGTAIREGRHYICNDFLNDPCTLPWRKDRSRIRWGASAAFPVRSGGRIRGALTVYAPELGFFGPQEIELLEESATDISFGLDNLDREADRERLESQVAQVQRLESVGRLAGGVAHDFNNMLSVVMGHAEMALLDLGPDSAIRDDLEEIIGAARRSGDLTRQLLAFARRQPIKPRLLDLNEVVGSLLKMLQRLIGEDIVLRWIPGHDLWPVKMDPSQVDQVLANLVVNARDAMSGTGTLTIETSNIVVDDEYCRVQVGFVPGDYVLLTVSDTGCGMGRDVLERIFEPFFTTKAPGQGTGLGLSTVFGIVKQNAGMVTAHSHEGVGSTFKIWLPRDRSPVADSEKTPGPEQVPTGSETILIAEDARSTLKTARSILTKLGYVVLSATSPYDAIRLAEEHPEPIHLLLTDVVMPEMNGKELASRLAQTKPGMKCLFMSGYTADIIAHHGVLDENVNFVQKPFSRATLARGVREALDG
ncbi:MAG TPA: PocR ligand-binding domain-containing protein [Vicinamibacterales bacterium]|jgi:PAS domain S-box-containing protein